MSVAPISTQHAQLMSVQCSHARACVGISYPNIVNIDVSSIMMLSQAFFFNYFFDYLAGPDSGAQIVHVKRNFTIRLNYNTYLIINLRLNSATQYPVSLMEIIPGEQLVE